MNNFFSTQESKLRAILTMILLVVSVLGLFVMDNDMHQAYAFSGAAVAVLLQVFYCFSDYESPF